MGNFKYILVALVAAVTLGTSCTAQQRAQYLSDLNDGDTSSQAVAAEEVPPPLAHPGPTVAGEWYLYPGETDPARLCNGLLSADPIPCKDILNVFVQSSDGQWSAKWMPEVFYHTENSPTWEDVCRTVDPSQWFFYGYTSETCASVQG